MPIFKDVVGDVGSRLYLLFGAVGFLLLIACVNIANLCSHEEVRAKGNRDSNCPWCGKLARWSSTSDGESTIRNRGRNRWSDDCSNRDQSARCCCAGEPATRRSIGLDWRVLAFALAISILPESFSDSLQRYKGCAKTLKIDFKKAGMARLQAHV